MVLPIVLPPSAPPPAIDPPTTPALASTSGHSWREHVVRDGETLYDVAQRYGTTVQAIRTRSGLTSTMIHPGQHLRVPKAGASTRAARSVPSRQSSTRRYTVRTGDTLDGIAARHGMSVTRLRSLNDLGRSMIYPGETLRVSGSAARAPQRPTGRSSRATHTVRSGETASGIAAEHGMSVARLLKLNGLSSGAFIHPGQTLTVQGRASAGPTTAPRTAKKARAFSHNTFFGRTYSPKVVSAAKRNRATLAQRSVPSRSAVRGKVAATARQHGVDPTLALAISYQESGWDQRQVSVANAVGVMQVIPSSGDWASQMAGRKLDLLDSDDNITAGVLILKALTRSASSDSQAVAGYYQGLSSVRANGMYADTKMYVAKIRQHRARM